MWWIGCPPCAPQSPKTSPSLFNSHLPAPSPELRNANVCSGVTRVDLKGTIRPKENERERK
ncbi:hypothetical protein P154DRAFT_259458 [Amniculicola lignicola CBS 123094]|uniref:Uncharacterized protein n=1 Tax=Amniculicola lignicola CBS 123094 TaxID=1392246 RepID=A0A6A5WXH6_9PLEO|nr:hypothetical protein P154DRAFT_259458 [Amniculicola lignicola CBS 123094]